MSANPIWIAGYFGPVAGASPVWIAPGDGTVPSAVQSQIVSYYAPVAGATAVWIAGYGGPPPAAIGAIPIFIGGYAGAGGSVTPPVESSVWSAADAAANSMTLSNGGLTVAATSGAWGSARGTTSKTSGKVYVEFAVVAAATEFGFPSNAYIFGLASSSFNSAANLGTSNYSGGILPAYSTNYVSSGFTSNYNTDAINSGSGDVWALAVDFTTGGVWIALNNIWQNSSNPATGSLPIISFVPATVGALFFAMSLQGPTDGVWTLQSTAASQKYAPPSGFSAWDGGAAPSHSAEALAYLARTVGGNEGGNGANIATLIDGLVSDGVWAKLDCLYVLAQQNATDALLNLVGTSYPLEIGGLLAKNLVFTSYVGFGDASGHSYLDTTLIPNVGNQYTLNSANFGFWVNANVNESVPQFGSQLGVASIYDNYGGSFIVLVNSGDQIVGTFSAAGGLFVGDRINSSVYAYHNGVSSGGTASPATSIGAYNFRIGAVPGSGIGSTQTFSAAVIGASLGAAGQLALYNRLRTYMTAIGVP